MLLKSAIYLKTDIEKNLTSESMRLEQITRLIPDKKKTFQKLRSLSKTKITLALMWLTDENAVFDILPIKITVSCFDILPLHNDLGVKTTL